MKKAILFTLFLLLLPICASAFDMDEERHYRASAELFRVLDLEKRAEASVEGAVREYLKLYPERSAHEDDLREFYGKYVGWSALENELLDLFTGAFSEEEIGEMIEFYKTPTGKKAAALIDTLYDEGVAARMKRAAKNVGGLEEQFK